MNAINSARVLGGGLVAGLVYNAGEAILNMALVAAANDDMVKRFGLPPVGPALLVKSGVLMFAMGILSVFLYAAIRPRFGAGPRTALLAGAMVWALSFLNLSLWFNWLGLFPTGPTLVAITWELVEAIAATLTGAWLYREAA